MAMPKEDTSSLGSEHDGKFTKPAKRRRLLIIIGVCVGVAIIIGLAVGLGVGLSQGGGAEPAPMSDPQRIDCYPENQWGTTKATKDLCEARGCEYDPSVMPPCYMSPNSPLGSGYTVTGNTTDADGTIRITLASREVKKRSSGVKRSSAATLSKANAVFIVQTGENVLRIKLSPEGDRFEVPKTIVDPVFSRLRPGSSSSAYEFQVTNKDPFAFRIIRKSTGDILWDTGVGGTAVSDQFLTISTRLPSQNIYGFGENTHKSFRHDLEYRTWPLFARDQSVGKGVQNYYGVHPFYTCLEESGNSHGVFLLNSNAMDYSFTPLPMLTYRTIGGVLDFYFFFGPTPENVVQQYTELIGRPYMPPYWALGFQLCRYGYNNLANMQAAVDRTRNAGIPQDIQYADIDHMNESMIFTIDNVNFQGLPNYFRQLQDGGMRTIIILDPCMISNVSGYEPFELGLQNDIFIKWPDKSVMPPADFAVTNTTTLLGYVWPKGKVAFPDFFLNRTHDVWSNLIVKHVDVLPFNGLWIDMNEPANFGTNDERPWNWPEDAKPYWSLMCPEGPLDDPPYRTMAAYGYDAEVMASRGSAARLSDKTLCMIAKQGENGIYNHYDVHNLYGASQAPPTLQALRATTNGERGIVVGRSTFPGTGHHMGHWLGDNYSEWPMMKDSIIGMLEFNLFGIPYVGADICGFFGETTAELCKRWQQLGAFYPYARNHNQIDNKVDQDPGNFNEEVTRLSRESLLIRYAFLPYLYTLFHLAHTRGNTVVRPLHHEFPTDHETWTIDEQFLWGSGFMVVPILTESNSLRYYLPAGRWYDFYTNKTEASGVWNTREILPSSSIPIFLRGGTIFPIQDPANNTHYSRQNPFRFLAYLDADDGKAAGELFWDDGVGVDTFKNQQYYEAQMDCTASEFRLHVQYDGISAETQKLKVDSVQVVGVSTQPVEVQTVVGGITSNHSAFVYSSDTKCLVVKDLGHSLNASLTIKWSSTPSPSAAEANRIDCLPEGGNETDCSKKGCTWSSSSAAGVPFCFLDSSSYGYVYENVEDQNSTHKTVNLKHQKGASMFGSDSEHVAVQVVYLSDYLLRVKIFAVSNESAFEVPVPLNLPPPSVTSGRLYEETFSQSTTEPFHIKISRKDNQKTIWDTSIGGLTISPQFLQLVTRVPTTYLYGLGEGSRSSFRRTFNYETAAMWSRDQPPGDPKANLYGVHPYYVCVDDPTTGSAHGVLLLNSNAMEVVLGPAPSVTYRTVGGLLDFYFVFGNSSEQVTQRYTELIGRPYLPPYWSLGFQLSRYGYNSLSAMQAALKRTHDAGIPIDVQYGDIDHMETQKDFTYDLVNFAQLPQYVDDLHRQGMRFIIILDPAIMAKKGYWPFEKGLEKDIYIRWPVETNHSDFYRFNSTYMFGYVWPPGETLFPDFFKKETQDWWRDCIVQHHKDAFAFDGLWIDMNEPANFDTNKDKPWNWPADRPPWSLKCPVGPLDDPPYKPKAIWGDRLSDKTICLVGLQTDNVHNLTQYNLHSLYGWSQTLPTLTAIRNATGERSIVISRSTYVGSGANTGHWLGDNDSSWPHMLQSIVGCLDFNLFGIPYIGADICGYFNNATTQLCERWTQLGAFYTFSRNHNGMNYRDQDPGNFGPEVAASAKFITDTRYSLLPYLYTVFYRAHVDGHTVMRPLFHEFPTDLNAYDVDRQFLWGPALLITPVLEENQTSVCGYLADARWFNLFNGLEEPKTHLFVCFDAPMNRIPLHVRGGHVIITQEPATNTNHSRLNPFGLIVAPDRNEAASGEFFWDDGNAIDSISSSQYLLMSFNYQLAGSVSTLTSASQIQTAFSDSLPNLSSIRAFGVSQRPTSVTVTPGTPNTVTTFFYDDFTKELYIYNLTVAMDQEWTITWS